MITYCSKLHEAVFKKTKPSLQNTIDLSHGQTSANRTKPGLSFQLKAWKLLHVLNNCMQNKTA
jgi:hypothetical protein